MTEVKTFTFLHKRPAAQVRALREAFTNQSTETNWHRFIATAYEPFGCDGAIAVQWCGMHLLIERDGYRHS